MKTFLLTTLLMIGSLFASSQCPSEYKIVAGGGNCTLANATGKISLTFPTTFTDISQAPTIVSVSVTRGSVPLNIQFSTTPIFGNGGNKNDVVYCYSADNQSDNILVGHNSLVFTLKYSTSVETIACIVPPPQTLPVLFTSFTATRQGQSIFLRWITATELNSDHFNIQMNDGTGWKTVGMVATHGVNGTSDAALLYSFQHTNTNTSIVQYRVEQVDINGRLTYTTILPVTALKQANTVVYPNPAQGRKINVVFPDAQSREVIVNDLTGRIVKRYNTAIGSVQLELKKGVYVLQIKNGNTVSVERVVVN
jgi:hypothetical protein